MSANTGDGWPPSLGGPASLNNGDQHVQSRSRPLGSYGPNISAQHPPSGQAPGPVLPPPPAPYYPSNQQGGHSIPALAGLAQPLPQPPPVHPSGLQPPTVASQTSVPQGSGYPLPVLGSAMQQAPGRPTIDRDREMRQLELRERDLRERQRHQEEMAQREREQQEREIRERQHRESQPQQNHAEPIPIHQPVASKVSTTIHGPGGLLSGIGTGAGSSSSGGLALPAGSNSLFGTPVQAGDGPSRSLQAIPAQTLQQQTISLVNSQGVHPLSGGVAGLPQGQQPILNDALSYLDQVKVQFVDQPDVYNRFLDIMKDFKSQAIDTPGVIERVSSLFAGHPTLIQGFNTFLPPGYRIECGTGDDPNTIRVTTPMGTTVSSMPTALRAPSTPSNAGVVANGSAHMMRPGAYYETLPRAVSGAWQQQPQPSSGVTEGLFGPNGRPITLPGYGQQNQGQGQGQLSHPEGQMLREQQVAAASAAAIAQHQQEQRGVSQLQSAVTAATGLPQSRQLMQGSPTSGPGQLGPQPNTLMNGTNTGAPATAQSGLEKRGPVEFNHAISYVNKIKNRFANQPDIYKQFLEILQTYQRESKPIQDVYAQVTHLFNSAPDLLEDFKQFLPESAAQAKAQAAAKQAAEDAAMLSNVRGEPGHVGLGQSVQGSQHSAGGHRAEMKMPPVGNFAPPPSASKESKKRRGGAAVQSGLSSSVAAIALADHVTGPQGVKAGNSSGGGANKRTKINHNKAIQPDALTISPTLTPAPPEPLPPTVTSGATTEEIAFFDRVKKFIGNKQTMNEFLKLCNLFSQDLIDKAVLVSRASNFIGANPELMAWFKRFVSYDGRDEIIENKPRPPASKVILSNCRGYGPSYRLLPKRERLRKCSGRDELCHEVLNDEWASHPTWASEDSGFVAHRKNVYEEALHRIEEERHEYDFHIEACQRTIQLLKPIAQSILLMSEEERANFTLPADIGGQSTTIYQRLIKKLYGKERGQYVIETMLTHPCAVVPVVLARLFMKEDEWKGVQREWDKVWREQTVRNYWRSLDHMGINAKTADKRQFTPKTLTNEISTRYEEQRRQRRIPGISLTRHQLEYTFNDVDVILDASRLLLVYVSNAYVSNTADRHKLEVFVKNFTIMFFGITLEQFEAAISSISSRLLTQEQIHEAGIVSGEPSSARGRGVANGKKVDLLRGVLGKNAKSLHHEGESIIPPGSIETTPDTTSAMEDDVDGATDGTFNTGEAPDSEDNWTQHPGSGIARNTRPLLRDIPRNEPFRRETYSLYCGPSIYCFFRMFQILYERLSNIKQNENRVVQDVRRAKKLKAAADLQMLDRKPEDFFDHTDAGTSYYGQVLQMIQAVLEQRMDMGQFEEVMRHFYLHCGWQLYAFDKLFAALARFALGVVSNDAKDKSNDIAHLFYKDRGKEETTHQAEISYRKQVEKLVKDGDVYRIEFNQPTKRTTIQILKKDDTTFDEDNMSPEARWSYYVASFIKVEPTEGVPIEGHLSMPFLKRNLPEDVEESEGRERSVPYLYENNLELRICVNSYKILWTPKSEDWFVQSEKQRAQGYNGPVNLDRASEKRTSKFREKLVRQNKWVQAAGPDAVDGADKFFKTWMEEGFDRASALAKSTNGGGEAMDED